MALASALPAGAQTPLADCSQGPIPDQALQLTIGEMSTALPTATLRQGGGMSEGEEGSPDYQEFDGWDLRLTAADATTDGLFASVAVLVRSGETVEGRTFRKLAGKDTGEQPATAPGLPEIQGWEVRDEDRGFDVRGVGIEAALRVEFGQRKGDVLPGRIQLCVPKEQPDEFFGDAVTAPVHLVGTFEVRIKP